MHVPHKPQGKKVQCVRVCVCECARVCGCVCVCVCVCNKSKCDWTNVTGEERAHAAICIFNVCGEMMSVWASGLL